MEGNVVVAGPTSEGRSTRFPKSMNGESLGDKLGLLIPLNDLQY